MENNPFSSPEQAPGRASGPRRSSWRRTVGAVFVLVVLVPALFLFVFYYREVSVTYYMTRNPLEPASIHLASRMEAILLGNMRALSAVAHQIRWSATSPSEKSLRNVLGRYIREGDLAAYAGFSVVDSKGRVLALLDRRDIDPYVQRARDLAAELVARGGSFRTTTIVIPGTHPEVILMTAVRTGRRASGGGGVLVALRNLSGEMDKYLPVPRFRGTPGRSYLLSSDGLVLASSDPAMVGLNLHNLGRGALLDVFSKGRAGTVTATVDGVKTTFGSALLVTMTGIAPMPWLSVLEAPKASIDDQVARTRLNMDLIVFLLVPAFFLIILFILYKSFRP